MTGLNASTGRAIDPNSADYLRRSIADILTTPIGTRVMRRDYGSLIPDLVDQPLNAVTRIRLYAATAVALMRWSRRARLKSVRLSTDAGGSAALELDLVRIDQPRRQRLTLSIPLPASAGGAA